METIITFRNLKHPRLHRNRIWKVEVRMRVGKHDSSISTRRFRCERFDCSKDGRDVSLMNGNDSPILIIGNDRLVVHRQDSTEIYENGKCLCVERTGNPTESQYNRQRHEPL